MIDNVDWDAIVSAAAGGGAVAATFKAIISKSIREIEKNADKIQETAISLSTIKTKLEGLDKIMLIIHEHDRKLTKLETRLEHDKRRNQNSD